VSENRSKTPVNPLRGLLRALLQWPLALIILFEEWGWEPLQRLFALLAGLPIVAWVERRISALPPYGALAVFGAPTLMLLPVKLLALWAIGQGHYVLGTVVIVVAKIAGTAIVARLFTLTRPALLTLPWFALPYARWVIWKNALLEQVRASWIWRSARELKRDLRRSVGRWFGEG
jgi:hypothetical protein